MAWRDSTARIKRTDDMGRLDTILFYDRIIVFGDHLLKEGDRGGYVSL
jgi:hypothetical protein